MVLQVVRNGLNFEARNESGDDDESEALDKLLAYAGAFASGKWHEVLGLAQPILDRAVGGLDGLKKSFRSKLPRVRTPVTLGEIELEIVDEDEGVLGDRVTGNVRVLGRDVRHDRRTGHPKSLQNDGFRVRHVRSIVQRYQTLRAVQLRQDEIALFGDLHLHFRVDGGVCENEHHQVSDRRVSSDEVLELEDYVLPVQSGLRTVEVKKKRVGEVPWYSVDRVQARAATLDYSAKNEASYVRRPVVKTIHVLRVERAQPRQEVDRVALIYVPKYLVEGPDDSAELLVSVAEPRRAHVAGEHVREGRQQEGLQRFLPEQDRRGTDVVENRQELSSLESRDPRQFFLLRTSAAGRAESSRYRSPLTLEVRPVAQCQC